MKGDLKDKLTLFYGQKLSWPPLLNVVVFNHYCFVAMIHLPIRKFCLLAIAVGGAIALLIAAWQPLDKQAWGRWQVLGGIFGHSHAAKVTDRQKHEFEHTFAAQCVARELADSTDPVADGPHWQKTCLCIAGYLMKNLTATEAAKFLEKNQSPQSLAIKYRAALYHCGQAKQLPQAPNLFARPQ